MVVMCTVAVGAWATTPLRSSAALLPLLSSSEGISGASTHGRQRITHMDMHTRRPHRHPTLARVQPW